MCFDNPQAGSDWNPWSPIPAEFNLGGALTRAQVEAGRGGKEANLWENAARASRSLSYSELDALSSRLASSLAALGVQRGDRVFLRLPNIPEFYIAALAVAKLGGVFSPSSTQFRASEVASRLK
jgi:acetyl-CoA synthetase